MPPGRQEVRTMYVPAAGSATRWRSSGRSSAKGARPISSTRWSTSRTRSRSSRRSRPTRSLTGVFKEFRVGLLHGRMKAEEKDAVMEEFRAGRIHALVSTLVVEVGIDVPNASIMVIDHCERYGLSQLHQLRGRIGRGRSSRAASSSARATSGSRRSSRRRTGSGSRRPTCGSGDRASCWARGRAGCPSSRPRGSWRTPSFWSRRARTPFALVARDPSLASAPELRDLLARGRSASLLHVG